MSQEKIHKKDLSDKELSPVAYMDILLSDLREQITEIAEAKNEIDRNQRISMMGEYLRGCRDGNRFSNRNPFEENRLIKR